MRCSAAAVAAGVAWTDSPVEGDAESVAIAEAQMRGKSAAAVDMNVVTVRVTFAIRKC